MSEKQIRKLIDEKLKENMERAEKLKQTTLISYIQTIRKNELSIKSIKKDVDKLARDLLEDLKKIDGWEVMIQTCVEHYNSFPDKFFGWCTVDIGQCDENGVEVQFLKSYMNDPEEHVVLTIGLNESLEEQVERMKKKIEEIEERKLSEIERRELELFQLLKKKYGDTV